MAQKGQSLWAILQKDPKGTVPFVSLFFGVKFWIIR